MSFQSEREDIVVVAFYLFSALSLLSICKYNIFRKERKKEKKILAELSGKNYRFL